MAALLQLVRGNDGLTTGSAFSLLDYTNDFNVSYGGWVQSVEQGNDPDLVSETITLRLKQQHARVEGGGQSAITPLNDVSVYVQQLNDKLRQAEEYFDDEDELYGIWLQSHYDGETYTRQALIRRGRVAPQSSFLSWAGKRGVVPEYILSLERFPWESTSFRSGNVSSVNCRGALGTLFMVDASQTVNGDTEARIQSLMVENDGTSTCLADAWVGFRSGRFGTPTNFQPIWGLGDSSVTTGSDTSRVSDSTAYGSYKAQCSFTTCASMAARATATLGSYTSYPSDQAGTFTVLMRAKVASSTICYARLLSGYSSGSGYDYRDRVKITSTSWKLYDMGTVKIPPHKYPPTGTDLSGFAMRIQAERTTGTTLDMNYLALIPRTEGFVYIGGAAMVSAYRATVHSLCNKRIFGYQVMSSDYQSITVSPAHFTLPLGSVSIVAAGQQAGQHSLTDAMSITIRFVPRWRMLRGNVT